MSVLGEAGGFEVHVGEWTHYKPVLVNIPHYGFHPMNPSEARALAALLVTAAEEAERGKRETERTRRLTCNHPVTILGAGGRCAWSPPLSPQ